HEQHGERGGEEQRRVRGTSAVLEEDVREPDERTRWDRREDGAPRPDGKRVRGEGGRPHGGDAGEEQWLQWSGRGDLHPGLLADVMERPSDRPEGVGGGEDHRGRLR